MLLTIRGVSKSFPGTKALEAVDFDLRAGEIHALLGENGAGKSTLIKCLTGAYQRNAGTITLDGAEIAPRSTVEAQELGIGTVYQEVNLLPNLTVAQNLMFGREPRRFGLIDSRQLRAAAQQMLAQYGLDLNVDRDLGSYSVAIQQIIAIARAVALSGKVLILDEPTASLDAREVELVFEVVRGLRDKGLGIIFVSHFLDQVFEITDRITVLRNGRKITTEETASLNRVTLIEQMLGRSLEDAVLHSRPADRGPRPPLLRFENFGRRGVVEDFSLQIGQGEVLGLAGLLGAGRTETAELLFGVKPAPHGLAEDQSGKIDVSTPRKAIAAGFGFAPEDRKTEGIVADLSLRENIILSLQARRGWMRPIAKAEQNRLADDYIKRLDIRTAGREKPIGQLSGGNQQKAVLARWLAMHPRFLILDEPTRGIDVGAHAEILRLIHSLVAEGLSLLVISSELDELIAVSDRVIVLRDRAHIAELVGGAITGEGIMRAIAGGVRPEIAAPDQTAAPGQFAALHNTLTPAQAAAASKTTGAVE